MNNCRCPNPHLDLANIRFGKTPDTCAYGDYMVLEALLRCHESRTKEKFAQVVIANHLIFIITGNLQGLLLARDGGYIGIFWLNPMQNHNYKY